MGLNDLNSQTGNEYKEKSGVMGDLANSLHKYKLAYAMMIAGILAACGGGGNGTNPIPNQAPNIANSNIAANTLEGTSLTGNIKILAGITDPEGDATIITLVGTQPAWFNYNQNTGIYNIKAPMVRGNKVFTLTFNIKDVNGNISLNQVLFDFTSVDGPYDGPLIVLPITGPTNVGILANATFQEIASDIDGIKPAVFEILDSNGVIVVTNTQFQANIAKTLGSNGKATYDMTLLSGLIPNIGTYTLRSTITGNIGGQNPQSQTQIKTFNFNIVKDSPALAKYTNFITTSTSITGDIACSDLDGINTCSSAITLDIPGAIPIYTSFAKSIGGPVNFTQLPDGTPLVSGTKYKIWTKINSFDASTGSNVKKIFFQSYTLNVNTPPTINLALSGIGLTSQGGNLYRSPSNTQNTFDTTTSTDNGTVSRMTIKDNGITIYDGPSLIFNHTAIGQFGTSHTYSIEVYDDKGLPSGTPKIIIINYNV